MSSKRAAMSSKKIEDLLQQCLEGYDGGMTPDECLSAFPAQRSVLEPLLRQALTLRMSYASAPSERFMARAKESLMFHAGRDVVTAMSVEPNEDFKMDARQRLIMAGGAAVQESLRDVPPPRLPFWVNARSRMLEAAKNPPAPQPRPVLAGRPALSMSLAGIVAAVAIAGAAFFTTQGGQPSAAAELAAIERQVATIEQQQANGNFISPDLLADITKRTDDLAARLKGSDSSQTFVTLSLQPLIDRQWKVIQNANTIKPPVGEANEAREQITAAQNQLLAAEEKVQAGQADDRTTAERAVQQRHAACAAAFVQQPAVAATGYAAFLLAEPGAASAHRSGLPAFAGADRPHTSGPDPRPRYQQRHNSEHELGRSPHERHQVPGAGQLEHRRHRAGRQRLRDARRQHLDRLLGP